MVQNLECNLAKIGYYCTFWVFCCKLIFSKLQTPLMSVMDLISVFHAHS